jgi:DNA polymerase III subunit gamma/tau
MTAYQVLARRWRPQRFEDLVGQDVVVRTLRNTLSSRQIAHAYLFSGLRGVGKTTVARLLAKALNCEHGPTPEPCGSCAACQDITDGSSMDVLEIDAASNRGIADIRDLREVARILPVRDRYRVFIVDEAHQLTDAAFNALLKILEEPPAHVIFILASTDKQKFPATILSRCLQVDFRPIPESVIVARMLDIAAAEEFPLAEPAAQLIARAADGSLRDALSLLDRVKAFAGEAVDEAAVAQVLGLPPLEVVLGVWRALVGGDAPRAIALARDDESAGHDPLALYEQVVELLHTVLLVACEEQAVSLLPHAHAAELAELARRLGVPLLLRLLALALEQRTMVAAADRPGLAVAVALGRLALWPRLQRVESLLSGESGTSVAPPKSRSAQRPLPAATDPVQVAPAPPAPRPAGTPAERLAAALESQGARLLAARVRSAEVAIGDGGLVLRAPGSPAATVRSLREASEQLTTAAQLAGLPAPVVVVDSEPATASAGVPALRERVEREEGVRRVVEVFGGRIDTIEETR